MAKVVSVEEAVGLVKEGDAVMIGGFMGCGNPHKVIDALVAIGIPRDALKTTGYNIYPVYEDTTKPILDQKVRTYQVTNTLTVTLHDVSKTGDVIDVAVANGINQASSIQFLLSDEQSPRYSAPRPYKRQ